MAKAIVHAGRVVGYSTLCVLASPVLEDLYASGADHTFARTLRRFEKLHVLLIEELGYEPFDSAATRFLFRLVSARHGQSRLRSGG